MNVSSDKIPLSIGECDHIAKYLCEALEWPLEPLKEESSANSSLENTFDRGKDVKGVEDTDSQSQPKNERDMNCISGNPPSSLKRRRACRYSATSSDLKTDLSEVSLESMATKMELTEIQKMPNTHCIRNSSRDLDDCLQGMSNRIKSVNRSPLLAPVIMLESVASSSAGTPSVLPPFASSSSDCQIDIDSVKCWDCISSAERTFNITPRLTNSTNSATDVLSESATFSRKKYNRPKEKKIPVQRSITTASKILRSNDPSKSTRNKKSQRVLPERAACTVKVTTSSNRLSRMLQHKEQDPITCRPSSCSAKETLISIRGQRRAIIPQADCDIPSSSRLRNPRQKKSRLEEKEPTVTKRSRGTKGMVEKSPECSKKIAAAHEVEEHILGECDEITTKRKRGRPRKMLT